MMTADAVIATRDHSGQRCVAWNFQSIPAPILGFRPTVIGFRPTFARRLP
jgi:hypothetical protein